MPSSVSTAPGRNAMTATVQRVGALQKVSASDTDAACADLRITISAGTAGTPAQVEFVITLNTSVGSKGTAQIIDETAASVPVLAKKSGNQYIFEPVLFKQPGATTGPGAGPGPTRVYRIVNVRANANGVTAGGPTPGAVTASLTVSGPNPISLVNAEQTIAVVSNSRTAGSRR